MQLKFILLIVWSKMLQVGMHMLKKTPLQDQTLYGDLHQLVFQSNSLTFNQLQFLRMEVCLLEYHQIIKVQVLVVIQLMPMRNLNLVQAQYFQKLHQLFIHQKLLLLPVTLSRDQQVLIFIKQLGVKLQQKLQNKDLKKNKSEIILVEVFMVEVVDILVFNYQLNLKR